jgi:hypothetical protein
MEILRRSHRFARLLLVWVALSFGIAVAAPLVQPVGIETICSGAGGVMVMPGGMGDPGDVGGAPGDMKHCRLCVLAALPSAPVVLVTSPAPAVPPTVAWSQPQHICESAAPLCARGPPPA